jgi:hypothetical protein
MMKIKWKKLLLEIMLWATAEIVLNLSGLDDLANYGEFVLGTRMIIMHQG